MVKLVNRAKMTVASGGAGDITLGTAVDGYQTFADAGVLDTNVVRYTIEDGDDWEIGTGVYTASGTTLVRTVTESSNSDAALTCSADAVIFVTMAAEDFTGNAAPIWTTTPPEKISLENDGSTAVTIAGVAIDQFPVRYSWDGYFGTTLYDADSLPPQLASAPTFSGGTATLIGSSAPSNGGSFNFRLKASDGVKTATAITNVSLSFGYNIGNIIYDNFTLDVGYVSGERNPTLVAFNPSGTLMFVGGTNTQKIHEYTLNSAFSLNGLQTAYIPGTGVELELDVSGQETYPLNMAFNDTGTKLYLMGMQRTTFVYTLSTPFSLSGASYSNVSFTYTSVGVSSPEDIAFNSDGTKLYICSSGSVITQCSLSTAYDPTTATSDSKSFDASSQVSSPSGITFNLDGSRLIIGHKASTTIHQYSLGTSFDISTASYDSVSHSIAENTSLQGLAFSADGNKMYAVGSHPGNAVYQYSCE